MTQTWFTTHCQCIFPNSFMSKWQDIWAQVLFSYQTLHWECKQDASEENLPHIQLDKDFSYIWEKITRKFFSPYCRLIPRISFCECPIFQNISHRESYQWIESLQKVTYKGRDSFLLFLKLNFQKWNHMIPRPGLGLHVFRLSECWSWKGLWGNIWFGPLTVQMASGRWMAF